MQFSAGQVTWAPCCAPPAWLCRERDRNRRSAPCRSLVPGIGKLASPFPSRRASRSLPGSAAKHSTTRGESFVGVSFSRHAAEERTGALTRSAWLLSGSETGSMLAWVRRAHQARAAASAVSKFPMFLDGGGTGDRCCERQRGAVDGRRTVACRASSACRRPKRQKPHVSACRGQDQKGEGSRYIPSVQCGFT